MEQIPKFEESQKKNSRQVTSETVPDLVRVRSDINASENKSEEQLNKEAEKYSVSENSAAYVVYEEGEPAGYVFVHLNDKELPQGAPDIENMEDLAHLSKIGVIESARGLGLGKKLLEDAENWAKSNNKKGIWLDYLADNEPALRLYKASGYIDEVEFNDPKKNKKRRITIKRF